MLLRSFADFRPLKKYRYLSSESFVSLCRSAAVLNIKGVRIDETQKKMLRKTSAAEELNMGPVAYGVIPRCRGAADSKSFLSSQHEPPPPLPCPVVPEALEELNRFQKRLPPKKTPTLPWENSVPFDRERRRGLR